MVADEVREDFGGGGGLEGVAGLEEVRLEGVEVFDDAVVDDGQLVGLASGLFACAVAQKKVRGS